MSAARDTIRAAIRASLAEARREAEPPPTLSGTVPEAPMPGKPAGQGDAEAKLARFRAQLESVGGRVHLARDEDEAREALAALLRERGVERMALSDSELVARLVSDLPESIQRVHDRVYDREDLLAADIGITTAQWGIAETGTIALDSRAERHRLASLVPTTHVAVLAAQNIVADLGELLAVANGDDGPPAALTLITGPSRTADIELTLVVGVHGPRELDVIVLLSE